VTHYGQLQSIFVLPLPADSTLGLMHESTRILALITPCVLEQSSLSVGIPYYSKVGPPEVVDLQSIQAVVGRVQDRGNWFILDRSGPLANAEFVDTEI
jgi:hypothetical protein